MKNKEVLPEEVWNDTKRVGLKDFVVSQSKKQSAERKLRNELLAIQYRIEDYIENENYEDKLRLLDFVKMYLNTLNVSQKKLAELFEMKDSNLHKYLTGERKLNANLVLKLSTFSHTKPEYWLRVEVKNELIEIYKEKEKSSEYQKYDYRNLLDKSL
ncbi:helix-turn-helix transcriptional regulator [Dyadobacter crusticola]|uniref:helix-turn-helix transcriptional regulator n=1 Tax=Dyadobacter crusticola TaxID=292407 RepID=UPI0004E1BCD8|nr:transcriptional regulator [Dyadobacter crusticola]